MQKYIHSQIGREDCHKKYSHHCFVSHNQNFNTRRRVLFRHYYIWKLLLMFITSGGKFCYLYSISTFVAPLLYDNNRKKFASADTLFFLPLFFLLLFRFLL